MKKLLKLLTSKVTIVGLFALLQILMFGAVVIFLKDRLPYFFYFSYGLSFLLVFIILRSNELIEYKLGWIITIMIAPIFGGLFYLTFKPYNITKKLLKMAQLTVIQRKDATEEKLLKSPSIDDDYLKQVNYLKHDFWPVYQNTSTKFLASGEQKIKTVIEELQKAQKYIFLEYFILDETGLVWGNIYPILKEKAKQGLDVRVVYDDFGSSTRLKRGFKRRLEKDNIKVLAFNPLSLRFLISHNNRNHKKIIVVDGHTGFTGGINIGDEYINVKKKYGHWHDAAIMIKGEAVYNMTLSFLQSWDNQTNTLSNYKDYKSPLKKQADGYVLPFSDSPFNRSFLSVNLYMQMISSAKKEIYITTPYFIVDDNFINTVKLQALSGVKIHIIIPGIPDKKFAYVVTKFHLKQLVNTPNVYIYSYEPGFVHSKILYVDDKAATIGTVNFDFRSFYLHFENTVWLYENSSLTDIKEFCLQTIKKSKILSYNDLHKRNIFYKFYETILVAFSHFL